MSKKFDSGKVGPKESAIAEKTDSLLHDRSGRASALAAGILLFFMGIGLALFVAINPMKVALFESITRHIVSARGEAGAGSQTGDRREVKYWQCPMHPTYISETEGTCGICGMDLVPKYEDKAVGTTSGERKIKYWRAPMDPTYISDKPGKSPMGMDLVPVYEDEAEEMAENVIKIDPATVQNIGVVTDIVKRGDLKVEVRTVGVLDYNDEKMFWVNTKFDGWIEKVYVNYVGQAVRKGEPLFEVYSPELVSTQEEYLSALVYREKMEASGFDDAAKRAGRLLEASRKRLRYWDITDEQISRLEEKGRITKTLKVVSPASGLVVRKMDEALEGMYAKAGMNLYKVADLSSLWLHVDLYEYQLPWIQTGQKAQIEISYYPGESFEGRVLFFYPYVDEKTRTIKACLEIPNDDGRLRPEMYATVKFSPVAAKDTVLVSDIAVLHSGKRNIVVLDRGGGRFESREVRLGLQGEGQYQVLEGLEGGEKIVTSAQFLIDSESNLREAINKMLMARRESSAAETVGVDSGPVTRDAQRGSDMKSMDEGSETKSMESGSAMKPGSETKHSDHETRPVVDEPGTIDALERMLGAYLPIWKALAGDSTSGVKENAQKLASAAGEAANRTNLPTLRARLDALRKEAEGMEAAGDLNAARESMKGVSRSLLAIFESHTVRLPSEYAVIECPMVKERWIQDTGQVSNPFFGSAMPRCGVKVGEIGGDA